MAKGESRAARLASSLSEGARSTLEEPEMETFRPRWEWRTFGQRFGPAEDAFAALTPSGVQESDELYLLSTAGDNVKVRDDLMDIKVLQETDADGLQRWRPVMKAAFPLTAVEATRVAEALRLPATALVRAHYTLDQFLADVVAPAGMVRVVAVHKRRLRYSVGGCASEVSDVTAEGRSIRTIAIEAEDPGAVGAAVRSMGLGGFRNIDYPSGLGALLDPQPARYAVIDVGTNSVKFHLGERQANGSWRTIADRAEVTRLGEGLEASGVVSAAALERTVTAIEGMVSEARSHDVLAITAVGTAGLRAASNADAVTAAIAETTGIRVEVIPGEEEGRLAYLAVEAGLGIRGGSLVVFDTGGGSSQFTFGRDGRVDERFSLPVGAVRYTEQFGLDHAITGERLSEALAAIAADLAALEGRSHPDALVGMGGAITNLTAVMHGLATYDPDVVQGSVLDRAEIDHQIERYRSLEADERRAIVGLQPKRADVILAGACIVRTVLDRLGQASLTVSDRGLRHGVLLERFGA
jgi:exopolyphosphatase/guanosine-5'-triphosphate,3'-diphosphate pyrophosphatase